MRVKIEKLFAETKVNKLGLPLPPSFWLPRVKKYVIVTFKNRIVIPHHRAGEPFIKRSGPSVRHKEDFDLKSSIFGEIAVQRSMILNRMRNNDGETMHYRVLPDFRPTRPRLTNSEWATWT